MLHSLVAITLALGASAASACEGETVGPGGFRGRSGATKVKIVVVCAIPEPEAKAQGGFVPGLAKRITEANQQVGEKRLREFAQQWSGKGPPDPKSFDELMKAVPPKYHAAIKEYFEKLEREANKK